MTRAAPRILVVDDNVELAENLAEILELEGIASEIAEDGPSALERLQQASFDLVITDIRMPGMDGVELLREIHRRWPSLLVVAMSAYASDATLDDAVAAGALDVLGKPVDCEQVIALARRVCEARAPILLVEDDRGLRVNLTEILISETDVVPYAVADLASANRLVEEVEFRVAIVDIKLPDGNGLRFGRELTRRFGEKISVLHITAFSSELDVDDQSLVGADTVKILEKPLAPSRLLKLLEALAR